MNYSRIDEPLYQLDEGNLWEYYRFKSITKSVRLATLIKNEFQWNTNKSKNLFERRGNFENITLFGMSGLWTTLVGNWHYSFYVWTLMGHPVDIEWK